VTNFTFDHTEALVVKLEQGGQIGLGEASGVYYKNDRPSSMIRQIESVRTSIEAGISRESLRDLLPPGGARNALDCALWDLEAKLNRRHVWELAALDRPKPLLTTMTCSADPPEKVAAAARAYSDAQAIKLKLIGEPADADRIRAARETRPDVWLSVDANQGFSRPFLEQLMPTLLQARVALIEQPFPIGQEALLDGFRSPIPIAADESLQCLSDLSDMVGRFDVVNIKLDKCGGLTEGLAIARAACDVGLGVMVGNMLGTSLATAPAYLVGQLCTTVDLDGPAFLRSDRALTVRYADGYIHCPQPLWGDGESPSAS
jgi:L-alanine-DL-glutamate epimerase-like enolase superfamily enzyme